MTIATLPTSQPGLEGRVAVLQEENLKLRDEIAQLQQEKAILRLKVDALSRRLFGCSSEKLNPAQLQLVFESIECGDAAAISLQEAQNAASNPIDPSSGEPSPLAAGPLPAPVRKKRSLAELIQHLPSTRVILTPAEVLADPQAWRDMGSAEETTLIDYTPGHFSVQILVRPKYIRIENPHEAPIIAPLPLIQERCMAAPRLLANTISLRFEQHLPYYRIEQIYERTGVALSRQTLCGWVGMAAGACSLLHAATREEVFADGYVQIDETPVKYQDPARKGTCGTGYLWVVYNPVRNISYFAWRTSRGATSLESIVPEDWRGIIQSDGYKAYDSFAKARGEKVAGGSAPIQLAGCMAHARRKFYEAKVEGEDPQWMLLQMQKLYAIEARLRDQRAGPEQIKSEREETSRPILKQIKQRLEDLLARRKHLPRSLTGEALSYTQNQWDKLIAYLEDGRVQIDNNLVENAIRPSAIGKKNWLFMGDAASGERAAIFYTLIGNCHRAKIDAPAYLTDLFTRLPSETNQTIRQLTPRAWAQAHATRASNQE